MLSYWLIIFGWYIVTVSENPEVPWFIPKFLTPLWQALAGEAVASAVVIREHEIPFASNAPESMVENHQRETVNYILKRRSG